MANSNIAVIANRDDLDTQGVLSNAVSAWQKAGVKVVGVLAEDNTDEGQCSAGFLRDLVSGQAFSIQLATPPAGTDCHLDATGVDNAATQLFAQIAAADIVVLSKFGKLEAARGGLWPVFEAAITAGKPLLTTVSSTHEEAWNTVMPTAIRLAGTQDAIAQWWHAHQQ